MGLKNYIQGDRRGKDANRLEREAMSDLFLQDAMDGFDAVAGNHAQIIEQLEKKYTQSSIAPHRGRRLFFYWSIAASILLLAGFSIYFFLDNPEKTMHAIAILQSNETEKETANFSSEPETVQMEETQIEMPTVARQFSSESTRQSKSLKKDDVLDVAEADVFVADAIVVTEIVADERVSDNFFASPAKATARKEQEPQAIHEKEDDEEVVVTGYGVQKEESRMRAISATGKSTAALTTTFGEKEFQDYCQQNGVKNICAEKNASVRVTFFIDETGKPTKIDFKNYSCEEAKKDMENLLSSSPAWTKTNRKVTMTVRW